MTLLPPDLGVRRHTTTGPWATTLGRSGPGPGPWPGAALIAAIHCVPTEEWLLVTIASLARSITSRSLCCK